MPAKRKSARKAKGPARKRAARKPVRKVAKEASKPAARKPAAPKPPPAPPSAIGFLSHHFDYTTHKLDEVKQFYTALLGFRQSGLDTSYNYLWVQTGRTSSLGFMPPMPGMGEPSPAKEPTLYFMVKDVDRTYADLTAKGARFEGPPQDMPWGHRIIRTSDPEGRAVILATSKGGM